MTGLYSPLPRELGTTNSNTSRNLKPGLRSEDSSGPIEVYSVAVMVTPPPSIALDPVAPPAK